MRFDLIFFDLDGTLVDSLVDIATALNHVLGSRGLAPLPVDIVRGLVGDGVARLAERGLLAHGRPAPPDEVAALAQAIAAFYLRNVCIDSRPFPGVPETLAALRATPGRRLIVLTNKLGGVARALLAALGLDGSFDAIIGEADGYPRKPAPDAILALLDRHGVAKDRALMVGDGLPDLAVARAAGIACAAAAWGYVPRDSLAALAPEFVLETPRDLLGIA